MRCIWNNHNEDFLYKLKQYLVSIKVATRQEDGLLYYHDIIIRLCMGVFHELFLKYQLKRKEYTDTKNKFKNFTPHVMLEENRTLYSVQIKVIKKSLCDIHIEMDELFWLIRDHVHKIDKNCDHKSSSVDADTVTGDITQEAIYAPRIAAKQFKIHENKSTSV